MVSPMHLFSALTILLVVLTINFVQCASMHVGTSDTVNQQKYALNRDADQDEGQSKHAKLSKRQLPVEGIMIGKRDFGAEGILLGKRKYSPEDALLGRRDYHMEGVLLGKREFPVNGILLGKREHSNEDAVLGERDYHMEGIMLGKRHFPQEGIMLGKRDLRFLSPKSYGTSNGQNKF